MTIGSAHECRYEYPSESGAVETFDCTIPIGICIPIGAKIPCVDLVAPCANSPIAQGGRCERPAILQEASADHRSISCTMPIGVMITILF